MLKTSLHEQENSLDSADLELDRSAIEAVIDRHARQKFDGVDPAWKVIEQSEISTRRLGVRRWLRRILKMGRNAREQIDVQSGYEAHWTLASSVEKYIADLSERTLALVWEEKGYLAAPQVLRQVHMLQIMRAIEVFKPKRVLEVGCGNANVVLTLAACFPEISFVGLELTKNGVAAGQAVQALPELPASFIGNCPQKMIDPKAHRDVKLQVGDASIMPFPDDSFDLIYTRLALEQMEQVREKALGEIARVSKQAVVLIEPWKDYNTESPGRDYVRRMGYFNGKISDMNKFGFTVLMATADSPQKVQFNVGSVVAVKSK